MAAGMDRMAANCILTLVILTGGVLALCTGCRRIPPPPLPPATAKPAKQDKTPAPTSAPASTPAPFLYTIKQGDRLDHIAWRFSGNKANDREIMRLNPGLDPRKLHEGDQIKLPGKWKAKLPPEQQLEQQ